VSFVNAGTGENGGEKIAFNYGRELFVYPYRGVRKAADLTKPIDKRVYKGTCPTCHDFGPPGCLRSEPPEVIPLLQIQIRTNTNANTDKYKYRLIQILTNTNIDQYK
jgi:hypothetical protein